MASNSKLGTVGIVRPTARSGGFEDLLRMLPEGIAVAHTCLTVQRGTVEEFKKVIQQATEQRLNVNITIVRSGGALCGVVMRASDWWRHLRRLY